MNLPDNDYQILRLTNSFYDDYPNPPFTEILEKGPRSYNCLLFQSHYDYFICIPYRSEVNHPNGYHFKNSARSKQHSSGLDYSKIVIITKPEYIGTKTSIIDQDEFNETMIHFEKIKAKALKFVEDYVAHISGTHTLHPREFHRRYYYSSLKYFHGELGIEAQDQPQQE